MAGSAGSASANTPLTISDKIEPGRAWYTRERTPMKTINIQISDQLHYDLKIIAAKTGNTLKSVVILALENVVNKQAEKEREGK